MNIRLSTQDILQVAENVEQREIVFYLRASKHLEDQDLKNLCWKLAAWSLGHKKKWESKRKSLGPDMSATTQEDVFSHPGAMAGLTWFGLQASSDTNARAWICREYLLREAKRKVNDLMTFYEGLKGFVTDLNALKMVDHIISEEVRHSEYIGRLLPMAPDLGKYAHQGV